MKRQPGRIVAIEGIDAVGKETQTRMLSDWLKQNHVNAVLMSFPDYGTPIGKEIKAFLSGERAYPLELQHMLFAANRWEKYEEIQSLLEKGETLVVNRYTESNLAYGTANGLDAGWLSALETGMPKADLVIVLDASPSSLSSRRPDEVKDRNERSSALQLKAQKAYRTLAKKHGWKLVNASREVDEVHLSVLNFVKGYLKVAPR